MTTEQCDTYPVVNLAPGEELQTDRVARVVGVLRPRFIQLRMKHAGTAERRRIALLMETVVREQGLRTSVVVNDDPAAASQTDSRFVHVGQDDVSPVTVLKQYPGMRIGFSTHTVGQFRAACRLDLSYIAFGPVFTTPTKRTGYLPVFEKCAEVYAENCGHVVFIGGITPENRHRLPNGDNVSYAVISALDGFMEVG